MNGTLALWYDATEPTSPAGGQAAVGLAAVGQAARRLVSDAAHDGDPRNDDTGNRAPSLELHLNLWRDVASRTNFLDIGFLLSQIQRLRRFSLYVPAQLDQNQLSDLSGVMRFGQTLNAVFNDVVHVGAEGDLAFSVSADDMEPITIHQFAVGNDVRVEALELEDGGQGALVVFTERLCERLRQRAGPAGNRQYLRLRLTLEGASRDVFSQEISTNDGFFVPSGSRLEVTELRLNEKRSYPDRVAELSAGRCFEIKTVHYFLIRDLRYQLVGSHAPFRKVRRLEARLWKHYLVGAAPSKRATHFERIAARLVIYHWRAPAPEAAGHGAQTLDDFLAFASFRSSESHLSYYAVAVVLLGGMGSSLAALLASLADRGLQSLGPSSGLLFSDKHHPNWANMAVVAGLGVAALLLVGYARLQSAGLRRRMVAWIDRLTSRQRP